MTTEGRTVAARVGLMDSPGMVNATGGSPGAGRFVRVEEPAGRRVRPPRLRRGRSRRDGGSFSAGEGVLCISRKGGTPRDASQGPPPVHLLDDRINIWQVGAVREGGHAVPPNSFVELFVCAIDDVGVERHGEHEDCCC